MATLKNPHTGEPRDLRDVQSDPDGVLIHKTGEPLIAAGNNSNDSDELDVLDVLDACETVLGRNGPWPVDRYDARAYLVIREARAAVAELIAADREYDEARATYDCLRDGVSTIGEVVAAEGRLKRAQDCRAAALARVGGAK